jgi:Mrp family chromosome partitioning ATPase
MWRGPRKIRAIAQFLGETAWPDLDYFIIDTPPGTGDETLAIVNMVKDLSALVVVTGHPLAIADAHKAIDCLIRAKAKIHGLVENMAGLICPSCGRTTLLHDPENAQKLANQTDLKLLARLPYDPHGAFLAERARKPMAEANPDSTLSTLTRELALRL